MFNANQKVFALKVCFAAEPNMFPKVNFRKQTAYVSCLHYSSK